MDWFGNTKILTFNPKTSMDFQNLGMESQNPNTQSSDPENTNMQPNYPRHGEKPNHERHEEQENPQRQEEHGLNHNVEIIVALEILRCLADVFNEGG